MTDHTVRFVETGEVRPPSAGEWFRGDRGPDQARFDFEVQSFPILRMVIEPVGKREG